MFMPPLATSLSAEATKNNASFAYSSKVAWTCLCDRLNPKVKTTITAAGVKKGYGLIPAHTHADTRIAKTRICYSIDNKSIDNSA